MRYKMMYFAYGSNMDGKRMEQRGVIIYKSTTAVLKKHKLMFNKRAKTPGAGNANVIPDAKGQVWGVLYTIDDQGISKLDRAEGTPEDYIRNAIDVHCDDKTVTCEIYFANPEKVQNGLKPTKEYLAHLTNGAKTHKLPKAYIKSLEETDTID